MSLSSIFPSLNVGCQKLLTMSLTRYSMELSSSDPFLEVMRGEQGLASWLSLGEVSVGDVNQEGRTDC